MMIPEGCIMGCEIRKALVKELTKAEAELKHRRTDREMRVAHAETLKARATKAEAETIALVTDHLPAEFEYPSQELSDRARQIMDVVKAAITFVGSGFVVKGAVLELHNLDEAVRAYKGQS